MNIFKGIARRLTAGRGLLDKLGFKLTFLVIPVIFSLLATFFEGITITALIPFVKGIITRDFLFVKEIKYIDKIFLLFPQSLERSNSIIFISLLLTIFIASVSKNLFSYLSSISVSRQIRRATANLRYVIFERYINFGKLFFDRNNIGQLQNILTHFSVAVGSEFNNLNIALGQFCMLLLYITLMFSISWQLTLFVMVIFPLFDLIFRGLITRIKHNSKLSANFSNNLAKNLFNVLSCITIVKIYNNEEAEKKKFHENNINLEDIEYSLDKKYNLITPLQEVIFLIAVLFLVAGMSFIYVKHKRGDLAVFMVYFFLLRRSQQAIGFFNRIKTSINRVTGPLNSIKGILDDKDKFFVPHGKTELVKFCKVIEFKKLSFSYDPGKQVLSNINFCIKKGETVAIVGETGSGKTTLASLLLRFYDCPAGTIFIDNIDIRDFNTASLFRHFAYVSQESVIFNDTIYNNILYGIKRPVFSDELRRILEKARLADFIDSLNKGLDTQVGDRGVKLSGGEKQRISIARALLKGADILVLDEATSSLDSLTEQLVQEAIDEAISDRTVLVIAHRLSTIKNADKIIVIQCGRVIEEGDLQHLIEKKGKFYEYWQKQKFY